MWIASALLALPASAQDRSPVPDFTFVQVSDLRIEPHLRGEASPPARCEESLRWMAEELKLPQRVGEVELPAPAFVVVAGDITACGAPGETWSDVERLLGALPVPWFPLLGELDQDRNPIDLAGDSDRVRVHVLRAGEDAVDEPLPAQAQLRWPAFVTRNRSGRREGYLFDAFGCRFVMLDSASRHDPRPAIGRSQLDWLDQQRTTDPIFVIQHHAPDSPEFAQPWQAIVLGSVLERLQPELVLHGHRAAPACRSFHSIESVADGSLSAREPEQRGYLIVSVTSGVLRVAFRTLHDAQPARLLVERPLRARHPRGPRFDFCEEERFSWLVHDTNDEEQVFFRVLEGPETGAPLPGPDARVLLDDEPLAVHWRQGSTIVDTRIAGGETCGTWYAEFSTHALEPGAHLLRLEAPTPYGTRSHVRVFRVPSPLVELGEEGTRDGSWRGAWPSALPAHVRVALRKRSNPLAFVCGSQTPLDRNADLALAVDASIPFVTDRRAYLGLANGFVRAEELESGERLWQVQPSRMGLEARPLALADLVVCGAWDGFVHALHASDGSLAWKALGPRASRVEPELRRDCAPADCPPVAIGDRIYVCDRGGELGWYSLAGELHRLRFAGVAAIGASADGRFLYLRGGDDQLTKITPEGEEVWRAHVALGRTPAPPVEHDERVIVCSDTGRVAWIDARTGESLASYRATAGAFVLAPLAVDETGTVVVDGADGSFVELRLRPIAPYGKPAPR